ncbi:cobyrinic acid a,c-diamide synthase [Desulfotomaculum arcticum]|uniref:Cobyrinate a,c-diamide synthase n=2 Tax=Desulfotruncus TaxID=2867377 RepID=A0A1I2S5K9_9FIRM|nr:cobyrinic acid a,c-diamide synthase [Desulfotomaculum arcticum] [Desulfotruncus arcticus DSM 17038]
MLNLPRIMIAGTHSGVGKTTVALAVMAMLDKYGLRVQPFKVGPDYIDPGFHQIATGRISRNLDTFFLGPEGVQEVFTRSARSADISVIEGVMGLYDGIGAGDDGSSARVAQILKCPVILVLDARSMAHSAAALVWGFSNFPGGVPLAGVIINRAGSPRHFKILKEAIEAKTGVPVLGGILREQDLHLPERHLGLVPSLENEKIVSVIDKMAHRIMEAIPVDRILSLAGRAPALSRLENIFAVHKQVKINLGVVRDKAFNFYYQDGLDLLECLGAEIYTCSALNDAKLPEDLDGLYIGGGFPEVFIEQLADNHMFIRDLQQSAAGGMPVYAECGGLMYLCTSIKDFSGCEYKGAGIIPASCQMGHKRAALGYVSATAISSNILVDKGSKLKGHEFHYSSINADKLNSAYLLQKPGDGSSHRDGHADSNILATYLHIHFAGSTAAALGLLRSCAAYRRYRRI